MTSFIASPNLFIFLYSVYDGLMFLISIIVPPFTRCCGELGISSLPDLRGSVFIGG